MLPYQTPKGNLYKKMRESVVIEAKQWQKWDESYTIKYTLKTQGKSETFLVR